MEDVDVRYCLVAEAVSSCVALFFRLTLMIATPEQRYSWEGVVFEAEQALSKHNKNRVEISFIIAWLFG